MGQLTSISRSQPRTGAAKPLPEGKVTYRQFLDWLGDETDAEWVDGEIILMPPSNEDHQETGSLLLSLMREFVRMNDLGTVYYETFQMKLPDGPGRSPDIFFVAKKNARRRRKTFVDGPADLAVEIVSPDSGSRDRGTKFYEYERGGVREYWLVDPARQQVEVYVRNRKGLYQLSSTKEGVTHSSVLKGFWIQPEWLWRDPQPTVFEVLKAWGAVK